MTLFINTTHKPHKHFKTLFMGNGHSFGTTKCQTAKLYDATGEFLRRVNLPVTAAELMLEAEAGHVISPASELRRTGKFVAMKADEELSPRSVYVLVPMAKLNRKVPEADVAAIVGPAKRKRNGGSRVSPDAVCDQKGKEGIIRVSDDVCRKRGYSRAWKPDLETIIETSNFRF